MGGYFKDGRLQSYNELVIDTRPYAQALPDSLAGFFVLPKSSGEQRRVAKDQHVCLICGSNRSNSRWATCDLLLTQ